MRKILLSICMLCLSFAQAATYQVKAGDTLSSIARTHNVSVENLVGLNNLSSSTLKIGQKLNLGGSKTASSKAQNTQAIQRSTSSNKVRTIAASWSGVRYVYGGVSRGGVDCSGFTMNVLAQMGVRLPHSSAGQFRYGTPVAKSNLREGDLLFFATGGGGISHVGLYLGGGQFIHASNPRTGVIYSSLAEPYYRSTYVGARRVL